MVYTPPELADFVACKLRDFWLEDVRAGSHLPSESDTSVRIIDPACGEGELLRAVTAAFAPAAGRLTVYGVDVDGQAMRACRVHHTRAQSINHPVPLELLTANALYSPANPAQSGADHIKTAFGVKKGFDLLIANPPWGADTSEYASRLRTSDYSVKKGQYDISDLFVEQTLSLVRKGGYAACILPDSLFGQERNILRKLLTTKTEIAYIGRMGEKIFRGINRGCVVIIYKNSSPSRNHLVQCTRLNNAFRNDILHGRITFHDADVALGHMVPQARFMTGPDYTFDIDAKDEDAQIVDKLVCCSNKVGDYVASSRGVELSKGGTISRCPACNYWMPFPTSRNPVCGHCGNPVDTSTVQTVSIIRKDRFKGAKPLLVGENLTRYATTTNYWITPGIQGINYKDLSVYYEPKILVRKTGVGITAAIDYSGALTNQVVYMFRPKAGAPIQIQLEFMLAILNSRAMYYFLVKKYGEVEWRSHPYLTQTQILALPVPDLRTPAAQHIQQKVVELVEPFLKKNQGLPASVDASVEELIAALYGLNQEDYAVIFGTLREAQRLLPVQALSKITLTDIFSAARLAYGA